MDLQAGLRPGGRGFRIVGGVIVLWAGLWIGRRDYGLMDRDLA